MLINQQQRDELELALSCTDHEYRLPVKHKHLKTDYTTSGFSREEAKEILISRLTCLCSFPVNSAI